jgi:hypothetical protein
VIERIHEFISKKGYFGIKSKKNENLDYLIIISSLFATSLLVK